MSQTTAQKEKAIRFGSGVLKIGGLNIGLLDNAKLNVEYNVIQIKAHNGNLPAKKKPSSVKMTAEIYEIDPVNLALVDWGGNVTNFTATPVNVVGEVLASWVVWVPIKLVNANANGDKVTAVVIGALVLNTAYRVFALNGSSYIEPLTAQTAPLLVNYTYTPASKKRYTISDVAKALATFEVVFENVDENGKKFSITIPKGNASGNLELWFVSDDAVDEVLKLPIEFTANADASNVLVYIDDEQNV